MSGLGGMQKKTLLLKRLANFSEVSKSSQLGIDKGVKRSQVGGQRLHDDLQDESRVTWHIQITVYFRELSLIFTSCRRINAKLVLSPRPHSHPSLTNGLVASVL